MLRTAYVGGLLVLMFTAWLVLTGTHEVRNVSDFARFGSTVFQLLTIVQLALAVFFSIYWGIATNYTLAALCYAVAGVALWRLSRLSEGASSGAA